MINVHNSVRCVALCCVVLCCVVLCCVVLCCVVLCCVVLCCVVLRCVALRCVALRCLKAHSQCCEKRLLPCHVSLSVCPYVLSPSFRVEQLGYH